MNVRNPQDNLVRVIFSKLSPFDKVDIQAVEQIQKTWEKSDIIDKFCDKFFQKTTKTNYYNALELNLNKPLVEKIIGFVQTKIKRDENNKKFLYLSYLIANPKMKKDNPLRPVKNIGEVCFGEVFNRAKKIKASFIEFRSKKDAFYHRTLQDAKVNYETKLDENSYNHFFINSTEFDKYLNFCKTKFDIKY